MRKPKSNWLTAITDELQRLLRYATYLAGSTVGMWCVMLLVWGTEDIWNALGACGVLAFFGVVFSATQPGGSGLRTICFSSRGTLQSLLQCVVVGFASAFIATSAGAGIYLLAGWLASMFADDVALIVAVGIFACVFTWVPIFRRSNRFAARLIDRYIEPTE